MIDLISSTDDLLQTLESFENTNISYIEGNNLSITFCSGLYLHDMGIKIVFNLTHKNSREFTQVHSITPCQAF